MMITKASQFTWHMSLLHDKSQLASYYGKSAKCPWIMHVLRKPVEVTCLILSYLQYIPRNMHTVTALLCFVVVIHWLIFPYPSGLLHWLCGNLTITPVPAKQPWWIWIDTSCEFIMNDCITTTKQNTTKPCAYFLGYTVHADEFIALHVLHQRDSYYYLLFVNDICMQCHNKLCDQRKINNPYAAITGNAWNNCRTITKHISYMYILNDTFHLVWFVVPCVACTWLNHSINPSSAER